jgi:hypothetical protein
MLLALETLSATAQWIVYLVALVLFALAGFGVAPRDSKVSLVGLGFAVFTFPLFWNNLAAS